MTNTAQQATGHWSPTAAKWQVPKAVADGGGGTIIAVADVAASPQRVFDLLTTKEIERWWQDPGRSHWQDWKADLRVQGQWSVTVCLNEGGTNAGWGEFVEIDTPHKLVMTRVFKQHPLQGKRETTITYRLESIDNGTRVTMREEGYVGRSDAAYANAERWELVLGWLAAYVESGKSKPAT